MDIWGIIVFMVGGLLYFITRRRYPVWLFVAGVGVGVLIGAVWHYALVTETGDSFIFTGIP